MAANAPQAPQKNRQIVLIAAMAAVIVLLVTVIIVLVMRANRSTDVPAAQATAAAYVEDAHLQALRTNVAELRTSMPTYLENVPEYEAGTLPGDLVSTQDRQQLAEAKQKLDDAQAQYDAALKQYNDALAQIEANTQSYNEGKALLSQVEAVMPYLTMYQSFCNGGTDVLSSLPGGQIGGMLFYNAQAWFASVVRPIAVQSGLEPPADVNDFPAYINEVLAESQAKMKPYEDALAARDVAKPQLDQARSQLDTAQGHYDYLAGEAALAEGAKQLRDGETQGQPSADMQAFLSEYEAAEDALIAEILKLMTHPEVQKLLAGDAYFGADYNENDPESLLWQREDNGRYIMANNRRLIDLDACETVIAAAQEYRNSYTGEGSPWD